MLSYLLFFRKRQKYHRKVIIQELKQTLIKFVHFVPKSNVLVFEPRKNSNFIPRHVTDVNPISQQQKVMLLFHSNVSSFFLDTIAIFRICKKLKALQKGRHGLLNGKSNFFPDSFQLCCLIAYGLSEALNCSKACQILPQKEKRFYR